MRDYSIDQVVRDLNKKHDIFIPKDDANRDIYFLYGRSSKGDVGIKSRGKIDFLKRKGYRVVWTTQFK